MRQWHQGYDYDEVAYQIAMVARLCRADSVGGSSLVVDDCAPTEIDYEGDGDGQIDYEDDESSEHPQDIHNFHVDLLYAGVDNDYSDEVACTSVVHEIV